MPGGMRKRIPGFTAELICDTAASIRTCGWK